jgi:class 3 adenylate cyclase
MSWLERAYEERSSWLVWFKVEPRFDRLRASARFASPLRRMRLEDQEPGELQRVQPERKLAAIMFRDIVGFTKLAQRDEGLALRWLEDHRSLLRPNFTSRGGREVKTIGDAFMVEFPSAVESVRCAVEVQAARQSGIYHVHPGNAFSYGLESTWETSSARGMTSWVTE